VEAYDASLSEDWRTCKVMHHERKEFTAIAGRRSPFIYVFGGISRTEEDNLLVERYHTILDKWEIL
jgi:hypothetical protein